MGAVILLYKCDPEKNTKCKKRLCQWRCKMTKDPEFAVKDGQGEPVIAYMRREGRQPEINIFK